MKRKTVWILNPNQKRNSEEKRRKALQEIRQHVYLLGKADDLYPEKIMHLLLKLNQRHGIIFRDVHLNGHVYAIPLLDLEDAPETFHFSISEVVEFAKPVNPSKNSLEAWGVV